MEKVQSDPGNEVVRSNAFPEWKPALTGNNLTVSIVIFFSTFHVS